MAKGAVEVPKSAIRNASGPRASPTRLIGHSSGWSNQKVGHYHSRHIYFTKVRFRSKAAKKRILARTEFGGYSLPVEGRMFDPDKVFGYKKFQETDKYQEALESLYREAILPAIDRGLAVLVCTHLSDVEDEINGLLTYDRKAMKMDVNRMRSINAFEPCFFSRQRQSSEIGA